MVSKGICKMLLITQPRAGTSHNEILALQMAAREEGWDVFSAPMGWRLTEEMIASGVSGVPYGSQTFCEVIAQQMNWTLKQNSFDWLAKLPEWYLQRKVEFMTLGEAKLLQETKFIKPADDKVFPAKVYAPGELVTHEVVSNDTPTLVSDVVQFDLEYRTFVTANQTLTWSNYIFLEHVADPKMWNMIPADLCRPDHFVDYMLDDRSGGIDAHASVIDVGRIPGKGWAIIETNQAWASGLYGCDPSLALKVMQDSCSKNES
jgi:hypothetical protein